MPSFAHAGEAKVIKLSTQGSKGTVVKILWEDGGFHLKPVVHNYFPQGDLPIVYRTWVERDDIFVFFEHIHQSSVPVIDRAIMEKEAVR